MNNKCKYVNKKFNYFFTAHLKTSGIDVNKCIVFDLFSKLKSIFVWKSLKEFISYVAINHSINPQLIMRSDFIIEYMWI